MVECIRIASCKGFSFSYLCLRSNIFLWCNISLSFFFLQISASFNLAEQQKYPKLMAESTWNYEIWACSSGFSRVVLSIVFYSQITVVIQLIMFNSVTLFRSGNIWISNQNYCNNSETGNNQFLLPVLLSIGKLSCILSIL